MKAKRSELLAAACILVLLAAQGVAASPNDANGAPVPLGKDPIIKDIIDNITEAKILAPLQDLVDMKTRYSYSPKITDAALYVMKYFNNTGLDTELQCFFFGAQPICNVIGVKRGVLPSKDPIIVSGHYDSIVLDGHDAMVEAPGADDDASGTVAAMAIADAMKNVRLNETVKFIGWVAEEQGLIGSTYYVDNIDSNTEGVKAVFQMDMIGNIDNGKLGVDFGTNTPSNWIGDLAKSIKDNYSIDIPVTLLKDDTSGGSDHAPFWAAGYHAAHIAETAFSPNWHKISDTIANLSTTNVARTAQIVAGMTATLAGVVHDGQGVLQFDSQGYQPKGNATLRLNDTDLKGATNYTLKVKSSIDQLDVQLLPVPGKGGEFASNITLEEASSGNQSDSKLQVKETDSISASYFDQNYNAYRNASAYIDGVPPKIANVTGRDITNESAAIYFETDEPSTTIIEYGTNTSLGSTIGIGELKTRQYGVLWGLKNDTDYYFKIKATDRLGNEAESNNSGAMFSFRTATISIKPEMPGYAGWVLSTETSGNHFDDDDMYTGNDGTDTYNAAVQFKTDKITTPGSIVGVSLNMATQTTGYMQGKTGKWAFQMLAPAIDNNFPSKTFSQIAGAQSESNVGVFTANDIAPAWWNTGVFSPTDVQRFLGHLQNQRITFRTSMLATGGLADWDTGYIKDATNRGLGPKWSPRLSVFINSSYATVEGATTSGGSPLSGALVTVLDNATGKKVTNIVTQVLGKYYLKLLPGKYDLSASKGGYLNSSMKTVTVSTGDHLTGVDFDLVKEITTGTLRLIVTAESTPLKGAEVSVKLAGSQVANGTTNASGGFEAVVEKGSYDVSTHMPGYLSSNKSAAITPKTITDVSLDLLPSNGWISGVVKDKATDAPLSSVTVKGIIAGLVKTSTQTDAKGVYNLSVLVPRKEYTVNLTLTGYLPAEKLVQVNTTWDAALVKYVPPKPKNGTISGLVVDEKSKPVADATAQIANSSGTVVVTKTTSADGAFVSSLPPGKYTVTVIASGYLGNNTDVTVLEGKQVDVAITLKTIEVQTPQEGLPITTITAVALIAIIAIVLIAVLLMRRKKGPEEKTPEEKEEAKPIEDEKEEKKETSKDGPEPKDEKG